MTDSAFQDAVKARFSEFKQYYTEHDPYIFLLCQDIEVLTDRDLNITHDWFWKLYLTYETGLAGLTTQEESHRIMCKIKRELGKCAQCSHIANLRCGACKQVHYCDRKCQKAHWATHKQTCRQ